MECELDLGILTFRFYSQMQIELENNMKKGNPLEYKDIKELFCDLEYHKAKLMMAIRAKNKDAMKEYIADCANILFFLGNSFDLYEKPAWNNEEGHELNVYFNKTAVEDIDNKDLREN